MRHSRQAYSSPCRTGGDCALLRLCELGSAMDEASMSPEQPKEENVIEDRNGLCDDVSVEDMQRESDTRCPVQPHAPLVRLCSGVLTGAKDAAYSMEHGLRGHCVIIHFENFNDQGANPARKNTDLDAQNLEKTFEDLSFEVHVKKDLTVAEMEGEISKWSGYDHSKCDAFVLCLMSHGEPESIHCKDGEMMREDIFNQFYDCSTLMAKPKLFFIQACRGSRVDVGASVEFVSDTNLWRGRRATDRSELPNRHTGGAKTYPYPTRADFLIADSTVDGAISFRSAQYGSCSINALCKIFGKKDLVRANDVLTLMTMVNHELALNFESVDFGDKERDKRKQVPSVTYTLTRRLFLGSELSQDST